MFSLATFGFLGLNFIPVHIVPPTAVASLVDGGIDHLSVELDIQGLLLVQHDGVLQAHMDDHQHLLLTGLENEVLDVAEDDICKRMG